jgi:hypothetical protein
MTGQLGKPAGMNTFILALLNYFPPPLTKPKNRQYPEIIKLVQAWQFGFSGIEMTTDPKSSALVFFGHPWKLLH